MPDPARVHPQSDGSVVVDDALYRCAGDRNTFPAAADGQEDTVGTWVHTAVEGSVAGAARSKWNEWLIAGTGGFALVLLRPLDRFVAGWAFLRHRLHFLHDHWADSRHHLYGHSHRNQQHRYQCPE